MSSEVAHAPPVLSLTDGGPGAALLKRLRLTYSELGAASPRTAIILVAVTWPPLCLLAVLQGLATGGTQLPFLHDIASHVRFLFAVPALALAEIPVGARLRRTAAQFVTAGLVPTTGEARFADVVADTIRFRDSRAAELVVLGAAYFGTYLSLHSAPAHGLTTWYIADGGLTAAGYWYAFVALPIFQFLTFRWIYRMVVWARFLRQVSKLDLQLTPTHPDGAAGLGFLGKGAVAFAPVLLSLSAVMASGIAAAILFSGAKLQDYQQTYIALIVIALIIFAGPLLVFTPVLVALKHRSLQEYGALASRYTQLFQRKWIDHRDTTDEPLLGSADIQSLADLSTSYDLVRKMRAVPIELSDFIAIALAAVVPGLPLLATVMPVSDILKGVFRLLG